jgi:transposase
MSEVTVKKYVVRLSKDERSALEDLISKGKHPAATILKARVLLKADVSDAGEGWSDSRIVKALDTSVATVARIRQRLVEDGLDAVLTRKHSPNSARKRVFDGAAEAKLIALACSEPPKGRSRWTLALLEDKVVELKIVERASDNTIGRVLKKTFSNHIRKINGSSRPTATPRSSPPWRRCWTCITARAIRRVHWSAWTRPPNS